jgi:hypothetical protein
MKKIGFFQEEQGVMSSTRLNTFIILIFWIVISVYQLMFAGGFANFEFHVMILTAAFAPKSIAKFQEQILERKADAKNIGGVLSAQILDKASSDTKTDS